VAPYDSGGRDLADIQMRELTSPDRPHVIKDLFSGMHARKFGLPEQMSGGVRDPLGAIVLYPGSTLYEFRSTDDVAPIGTATLSGCIRMSDGMCGGACQPAGTSGTVGRIDRTQASERKTLEKTYGFAAGWPDDLPLPHHFASTN